MNFKELLLIFQNEELDPRMAPEAISTCYLHCVLKGLHRAPRLNYKKGLGVDEVDFLVSPHGCFGTPHFACLEAEIPIIIVKENKTCLNEEIPGECIFVENYWEAAGYIMAAKSGVHPSTVRRLK